MPVPAPAALSGAAGGGRLWREWEFADLQAELEWRQKQRQKDEALLILLGVL